MNSDELELVQAPLFNAAVTAYGFTPWTGQLNTPNLYRQGGEVLTRGVADVLVKPWLTEAIRKLNPSITVSQIDDAVAALEKILASTGTDNIVEQAKLFLATLRSGPQVRNTKRLQHVIVIDFDNPTNNRWDIVMEVSYKTAPAVKGSRYDIVLYCNGIPLVVTETKSMTDPNSSWQTAAKDLAGPYTKHSPAFLAAGLVQVATDGREVRYGGVRTSTAHFQVWGSSSPLRPADGTWEQVEYDFLALHDPAQLLAWAQDFILHQVSKSTGVLTRYIPRWPQAEAAPLIVARALDPNLDRGLIDHFQGSGKSMAMLMAANAINRIDPKHLVIMVVDRRDLLSQHKGDFTNSDARRSVIEAENGAELVRLLRAPTTSGQLITTVHRFADLGVVSLRKDITILIDEAHRSQEGDLGRQMREALPNATLIGLTGTPIATSSHNTFEAFGCPADDKRVMHRYTAANSVKDGTTVRLELDRRKIVQGLNQAELDEAYEAYRKAENLSSSDAEIVAKAVTKYNVLLKDPRRVAIIARDIAKDMTATIIPAGYGAMVVVADREACVLYVEALRKHLNADQVTAVISSGGKDDPDEWAPYIRDSAAEAAVANAFRDPANPLKLLVVTSKLLAGFDAPNALAMFIDKPMRDHTLFQAVTRVNRTYTTTLGVEKGYGVIIDYCGVTPAILEAFSKNPDDVKAHVILTPEQLVTQLRNSLTRAERVFGEDFDWTAPNPLHRAKTALASDGRLWRIFRQNVNRAELIFETIPTNKDALTERTRLRRLVAVLHSYGTSFAAKKDMLVLAHGQAVRDLILDNTGDPVRADLNIVTLTPERIKQLIGEPTDPVTQITELQSGEVLATIRERLKARLAGPHAADYDSIAAKLEAFAATKYVPTVDGVQAAAIDLVELAKQLKAVDDLVGEEWEELDIELTGWSRAPEPVLTPGQALEQILAEYSPKPLPVGLDDVAAVLDEIVDKLSYRKLRDDPAAQKQLRSTLVTETKRLGLLPTTKQAVNDFIDQLRDYVNIYLT